MQIDLALVLILSIPILATVYKLGQTVEAKRMRRKMGRHSESQRILKALRDAIEDDDDR